MIGLIKKYWDIISGTFAGIGLAFLAKFKLEKVQLYYSIIILVLVSIGVFRIVRQAVEKQREKKTKTRKHNLIDTMVDGQKSIKAISLATEPTKEGEKVGKLFIDLWEVNKKIMKKIKTLYDKYKGYFLTIALGVLTAIEQYGGYINDLCGGKLVVNGIEIIPLITLVATIIVGIISNGFTKEQMEKIKALFSKSSTEELIMEEIKKSIKDNSQKLTQFNKIKSTKEAELENLKTEMVGLKNTLQAKEGMYNMTPRIATLEDVQLAQNAVSDCALKINNKEVEIAEVKATIDNLNTTIKALKSQL